MIFLTYLSVWVMMTDMNQRTRIVLGLTILASFLFFFGIPPTADSAVPASAKAYRNAERCISQVRQTPPSKQTSTQWKQCLTQFKSVAQKYAGSSVADAAAFQTAEIYQNLYQRSKDEKERREAVNWYQHVIDQYPDSLLKKNADRAIARLTPPITAATFPDTDLPTMEQASLSAEDGTADSPGRSSGVVKGIRHWKDRQYTRVVVDLASPAPFNFQMQDSPPRLVIDLRPARVLGEMTPIPIQDEILRDVQAGQIDPDTVRVVIGMEQLRPYKVFSLSKPDRIVIDVLRSTSTSEPDWLPAIVSSPPATIVETPSPASLPAPKETVETPLPWDMAMVKGIRNWTGNRHTRVVVDLSSQTTFNPQIMEDPPRLVVDLRP
ncbi:MAG: AMIN domain-containing protein, partial [Nitrospirae bacterium]|nr:AMIN domain-containing protein [Nitrospirota bacterium]